MRKNNTSDTDTIYSKIAGTTSGEEAETRQYALEMIQALVGANQAVFLDIVPDETNKWDRDALALYANLPDIGRTQLGFVGNSQTTCDFCGMEYERYPSDKKCKRCGHEELRRNGLASKIAKEMRADRNIRFYGMVTGITGGVNGKPSRGCNIVIRKRIEYPKVDNPE